MTITSDKPIESAKQDSLGRDKFARRLAESLLASPNGESTVIALYGPWGSGKTSLLNMAIEQINAKASAKPDTPAPLIFRFNPWHFSNQEQIIAVFFAQLLLQIKGKNDETLDAVRATLRKYGGILTSFPIEFALSAVSWLGPFAPQIRQALEGIGPILADTLLADNQDIESLRKDVDEAFRKLGRKVIVVIDDLDRLTRDEIRQMFQLIKLNADFPNTIFLIAADREILEKSLSTEQNDTGRKYLEKIVQVGFDIPVVEPTRITSILTREIDANLELSDPALWNQERWESLFHAGFKHLFTTLRVVKRYVNSLAFNYRMVANEVSPIDFLGIEAIRVFEPKVYEKIAGEKVLFCSGSRDAGFRQLPNIFARQLKDEELKESCEEIFESASVPNREYLRKICLELFPALQRAYPDSRGRSYERSEALRRQRRIASIDVFDHYFLLGTPQGEVSRAELLNLKRSLKTVETVVELLNEYIVDGRIRRLLELAPDIENDISPDEAQTFATALIQIADTLPEYKHGSLEEPLDRPVARRIWAALEKLEQGQRLEWFRSRIAKSYGTYHLVVLASRQRKSDDKSLHEDALFDETAVTEMEALCVKRIRSMADKNELRMARHTAFLLEKWHSWESDNKRVAEYITSLLTDLHRALKFLKPHLSYRDVSIGPVDTRISINEIAELIDPSIVDAALLPITPEIREGLSEEDREVFDAWKRSYLPESVTSGTE